MKWVRRLIRLGTRIALADGRVNEITADRSGGGVWVCTPGGRALLNGPQSVRKSTPRGGRRPGTIAMHQGKQWTLSLTSSRSISSRSWETLACTLQQQQQHIREEMRDTRLAYRYAHRNERTILYQAFCDLLDATTAPEAKKTWRDTIKKSRAGGDVLNIGGGAGGIHTRGARRLQKQIG